MAPSRSARPRAATASTQARIAVGESGLLGADLHAPAGRQGVRDGREAIGGGRRAGVQRQVREIHRQPDVRRRWRQGGDEREVVLEHLVGDRRIADALPEQVDADAVTPLEQRLDGGERAARATCPRRSAKPPATPRARRRARA